jgi:hypothetical protein
MFLSNQAGGFGEVYSGAADNAGGRGVEMRIYNASGTLKQCFSKPMLF